MTKSILFAAAATIALSACENGIGAIDALGPLSSGTTYNIPRAVDSPILGAGNQQFTQISSGFFHVCGLDADGRAWCWGDNQYRQAGRSDAGTRCDQVSTCVPRPMAVETDLRLKMISAGTTRTCAIALDGTAYCWGGGYYAGSTGMLGDGLLTQSASPVRVSGGLAFKSISVGGRVACAIALDDSAYCWGDAGSVGDGQRADALTPTLVAGNHRFSAISSGTAHACAIDMDGVAWCWGSNQYGQIGDGRVTGFGVGVGSGPTSPTRVATDRHFKTISAGGEQTCATSVDGENLCWGDNGLGQLGIGAASAPQPIPTLVKGGSGLSGIATGTVHTCAIDSAGAAECWGGNWFGALGNGTSTAQNTGSELPTPTLVHTSVHFTQISPGGSHTCALATDSRVWCWGDKGRGQIGDGSVWN